MLSSDDNPTVLDLFCGCGGLSLGLESAGFRIVGGNDSSKSALAAFAHNHPDARILPGDIKELSAGEILTGLGMQYEELDVIVGGPPCQGFSQNKARRHAGGRFIDDPRNYLFKEFLRCVEHISPRLVVIENVPQILIKEQGAFKREIREKLADMGYQTVCAVLNAADYGVPQKRRRAIIAGSRIGAPSLPQPTHQPPSEQSKDGRLPSYLTVWDAIGDLPSLAAGQGETLQPYAAEPFTEYQQARRGDSLKLRDHVAWQLSPIQMERISYLSEGDRADKLPAHLAPKNSYGSAYRRMRRDEPALTITTWLYHIGSGMFCHPVDDRSITLREAARLQSFDDNTHFLGNKTERCRQVGNAVPPLLGRAVGEALKQLLDRH